MADLFDKLCDYIRENKTWSELEDSLALDKISSMRCDIDVANPDIKAQIYDLMEEYKCINNLPEGEFDDITEDEVFMNL